MKITDKDIGKTIWNYYEQRWYHIVSVGDSKSPYGGFLERFGVVSDNGGHRELICCDGRISLGDDIPTYYEKEIRTFEELKKLIPEEPKYVHEFGCPENRLLRQCDWPIDKFIYFSAINGYGNNMWFWGNTKAPIDRVTLFEIIYEKNWEEYIPPVPRKRTKRYWQWKINKTAWHKSGNYLDDNGRDTYGKSYKGWSEIEKIKIEDDYIEV